MITAVTGDGYQIKTFVNGLLQDFVKKYGDMAVEKVDGDEVEYSRILDAVQNLPFLSEKKLVLLYSPSAHKQFQESFETIVGTIPEQTDVVIIEPKLDKRLVYTKQLKKTTDYHDFSEKNENELISWLVAQAKSKNAQISATDARYLVERVGANQILLSNELDKLISYDQSVTKTSIDLLTEPRPQSTIFELVDAACSGNAKKALALYREQRKLKVEPMAIVGMLGWQLHVIALIVTAGNRSTQEIATQAKLHPFVVSKNLAIAKRLGLVKVKKLAARLREIDTLSKSTSLDTDEAVQTFIIELSH